MDASFWLKLMLSFIIGGLWISLATLSAERFGTRVGGIIAGLPSTVVISLFFIGLTQSPEVAAQATTLMPLAQGFNGWFVVIFLFLFWLAQFGLLSLLDLDNFTLSILGWLILLVLCYFVIEKWMKISSLEALKLTYHPSQVILRALFGGAVISFAVFMGKLGGPQLGGIFGSFPAIFLSTLVITNQTRGPDFTRAVGKPMLISGLVNVPLYEIAVRLLYPRLGLGLGTLLALLFALLAGYLTFQFIKSRMI
jgi:hypothetical protein